MTLQIHLIDNLILCHNTSDLMRVERRWINLFIVCCILCVQYIAILIHCLAMIHHAVIEIYSVLAWRKSLHHHNLTLTFFHEEACWLLLVFLSRFQVDILHLLVSIIDSLLPVAHALRLISRCFSVVFNLSRA